MSVDGAEVAIQVEGFIASNGIDELNADILRSCDPSVQAAVLTRGDLSSARNPASVLKARIRDAQNGVVGGGQGWGGQNSGAAMFAGKGWTMAGGKGSMFPARGKGKWGMPDTDDWTAGWGPPGGMQWGGMGGMGGPAFGRSAAAGAWGGSRPVSVQQPEVLWVKAAPDSKLLLEGLPAEAPAITYDKAQTIFQSSAHMLSDLVGDIATSVAIHHDPDWQEFPEIGESLKEACGEENCFAVAVCASHGKWAVGAASGWKGRESSVKLALCVALTVGTDMFERIARQYPEFRAMCSSAGLVSSGSMDQMGKGGIMPAGEMSMFPQGAGGGGCMMPLGEMSGMQGEMSGMQGEMSGMLYNPGMVYNPEEPANRQDPGRPLGVAAMPPVNWIMLMADSPLVLEGFPVEGVAVLHEKMYQDYFRNAHHILTDLIGDMNAVSFNHDPDWDKFPDIAEALKQAGMGEHCFCVVTCPSRGKWAVGVGGGWKSRESAGKLAMSLALAMGSEDFSRIMETYPEFAEVCISAGLAGQSEGPAQKKLKTGLW